MTGSPEHDKNATAPNFLLAHERLQPAWVGRWITDPAKIIPGTAMPSGLFKMQDGHWVFSGPEPASLQQYHGDQADLLVRYMFSADAAGAERARGPHAVRRQHAKAGRPVDAS